MKHTGVYYEFPGQLLRAHDATTPQEFAQEAYERTTCGVWTAFILAGGGEIPSGNLTDYENRMAWMTRHCVGVKHGTIY